MAQLQNVRLKAHKGLKQAFLSDLGKVNVICGPNNSGKTTVLECLQNNSLLTSGIAVSQGLASEIAAGAASVTSWSGNAVLQNLSWSR